MRAMILTLLVIFGSSAMAQSCRDIDVRDRMSPEIQKVFRTPYQQGKVGWCYAYATADLLSARLNHQFSPFHIGLSYSTSISGLGAFGRNILGLKNKGGFFDAGLTHDAFAQMKKKGYGCSESVVNSQMDLYGSVIMYFQQLEDIYKNKSSDEYGLAFAEISLGDFMEERFPTLDSRQAISYVKSRKDKSAAHALAQIAESACQGHQFAIPQGLRMVSKLRSESEPLAPIIDKALNSNRPVSLRYNMKNLVSFTEGFLLDNFSQHVSTIVGRKKVGNQCMYIVRNSWGPTCHGYKQGIFCNEEEGTFQIPAKELERAAYSIEYIAN